MYQGTSLFAEHALLEEPSGLCFFHGKGDDVARPPAVAVSAGPYIFIYRQGNTRVFQQKKLDTTLMFLF